MSRRGYSKFRSERRQIRRNRKRFGMRISGGSIKSVIVPAIQKRYGKKRWTTRGLEFGNQELASPTEDRREAKEASQKDGAI